MARALTLSLILLRPAPLGWFRCATTQGAGLTLTELEGQTDATKFSKFYLDEADPK